MTPTRAGGRSVAVRIMHLAVLIAAVTFKATPANAATCESLTRFRCQTRRSRWPRRFHRNVHATRLNRRATGQALAGLPAFCRVAATLKPTSDSESRSKSGYRRRTGTVSIKPSATVAGRDRSSTPRLAEALKRGYATSSTDTGHVGGTAKEMLGHPEKLIDYWSRAIHEMTVKAKAITEAFYGNAPRLSYFVGCSAGGRQAMLEAQRYPDDFNGIIAGAPAIDTTPMYQAARMWFPQATLKDPASYIPPAKYPMIHQAVVNACDAIDGLKDGLIDDPRHCRFDPKVLECKSGDSPSCLTAPQVEAATKIMSPVKHPRTGKELLPRTGTGYRAWLGRAGRRAGAVQQRPRQTQVRHLQGPELGLEKFNFATDLAPLEKLDDPAKATDPNLSRSCLAAESCSFITAGPISRSSRRRRSTTTARCSRQWAGRPRRLMVPCVHGAGDGALPRRRRTEQFRRADCAGNLGEKGRRPTRSWPPSARGKVDRTRPLCAYPTVARYKGTGSIDDAANFVCRMP